MLLKPGCSDSATKSDSISERSLVFFPPETHPGIAGSRLILTVDVYAPAAPIRLDVGGGRFLPTENKVTYLRSFDGINTEIVTESLRPRDFVITGAAAGGFGVREDRDIQRFEADISLGGDGEITAAGVSIQDGFGATTGGDAVSPFLFSHNSRSFSNPDALDEARYPNPISGQPASLIGIFYDKGDWTFSEVITTAGLSPTQSGVPQRDVRILNDAIELTLEDYCESLGQTGEDLGLFGRWLKM